MLCPACSHEVSQLVEFTTGGLAQKCPRLDCGAALGTVPVSTPGHGALQAEAPTGLPSTHKLTRRATAPTPTESFDVVKAAKARLREVKRQLKAMKALEAERAQLERLLAAAERPLAEVKRLRATS